MLKNAPIVPYIPVADVARARKFYEEKVGLVPREEVAGGVVYECGNGSWTFMYPSGGAGTSKASQAFWQVKDVEAEVAELRAKGVVFEEYRQARHEDRERHRTAGGNKAAWFKDTEGNILALIQSIDRIDPHPLPASGERGQTSAAPTRAFHELEPAWECQQSVDADVPVSFAWQHMTTVSNWSDPPAEFTLDGPFATGVAWDHAGCPTSRRTRG